MLTGFCLWSSVVLLPGTRALSPRIQASAAELVLVNSPQDQQRKTLPQDDKTKLRQWRVCCCPALICPLWCLRLESVPPQLVAPHKDKKTETIIKIAAATEIASRCVEFRLLVSTWTRISATWVLPQYPCSSFHADSPTRSVTK